MTSQTPSIGNTAIKNQGMAARRATIRTVDIWSMKPTMLSTGTSSRRAEVAADIPTVDDDDEFLMEAQD